MSITECRYALLILEWNLKSNNNDFLNVKTGTQMKTSEDSIPPTSKDFVILCNRRVDVCKNILMNFKTLYSFQNEFQWVTKARDAKNVKKRVLVCLKISRLTDDIADAIRMVDLSGMS